MFSAQIHPSSIPRSNSSAEAEHTSDRSSRLLHRYPILALDQDPSDERNNGRLRYTFSSLLSYTPFHTPHANLRVPSPFLIPPLLTPLMNRTARTTTRRRCRHRQCMHPGRLTEATTDIFVVAADKGRGPGTYPPPTPTPCRGSDHPALSPRLGYVPLSHPRFKGGRRSSATPSPRRGSWSECVKRPVASRVLMIVQSRRMVKLPCWWCVPSVTASREVPSNGVQIVSFMSKPSRQLSLMY